VKDKKGKMLIFRPVLFALALAAGCAAGTQPVPMNTQLPYVIANPGKPAAALRTFHGEYFEMLGPEQTTHYSEVFWESQPLLLPLDIRRRFNTSVMAVTGMEVDIVRTTTTAEGASTTESASCKELYNHHYSGWMYGRLARMEDPQTGSDDNPFMPSLSHTMGPHGRPLPSFTLDAEAAAIDYPNVQGFSEGNGNEHRASFKGYARGFAQLIYAPTTWANNPMVINTNKNLTPTDPEIDPGPIDHTLVPAHSLAPKDSTYSGIIECPCTTRKIKILDGYEVLSSGSETCGSNVIATPAECKSAAAAAGLAPMVNDRVQLVNSQTSAPSGCFGLYDEARQGWTIAFNKARGAQTKCGGSSESRDTVGGATTALGGATINIVLSRKDSVATITVRVPSNHTWFAIGFNASAMKDMPYTIVVNASGGVEERLLGNHAAGSVLSVQSVTAVSTHNNATDGTRTVVIKRPLQGATSHHYSFDLDALYALPLIHAYGTSSPTISYHDTNRVSFLLEFAAVASDGSDSDGICICRDPSSNAGSIDNERFNPSVCAPFPTGELLTTHNAICNISEYEGGLYCCHHGSILLDADQDVPKSTDTWRFKYRFYFEEYQTDRNGDKNHGGSHQNLFRTWWSTEATNNEYDVPQSTANCLDKDTPSEKCVHKIRTQFRGRDILSGPAQCMVSGDPAACANVTLIEERDGGFFHLMYAAAHCHTPACQSLELWNDDTGELICRNAPTYGNGTDPHNELSYVVAIPPCLWGTQEEGLLTPPRLHLDTNLSSVKRANNTHGHWGVMALWQMRAAYAGGNPWKKSGQGART
jgi:hypothetical protein